jgi:hypothetical protein
MPHPDGGRLDELRRRLRLAYLEGAEEWTRETVGRPMSNAQLTRALTRFPG